MLSGKAKWAAWTGGAGPAWSCLGRLAGKRTGWILRKKIIAENFCHCLQLPAPSHDTEYHYRPAGSLRCSGPGHLAGRARGQFWALTALRGLGFQLHLSERHAHRAARPVSISYVLTGGFLLLSKLSPLIAAVAALHPPARLAR